MFFYHYEKYIMHGRQVTLQCGAPAEQPLHTELLKQLTCELFYIQDHILVSLIIIYDAKTSDFQTVKE